MRRLAAERKHRDERGVTAIVVALGMTTLLAAAGLGIDSASLVFQRSRVQHSADASAIAIAYDCVNQKAACSDGGGAGTATYFVNQNSGGGTATVPGGVSPGAGSVRVKVNKTVPTNFFRAFGINSKDVSAQSRVTWAGHPVEGAPVLPMGVPLCTYQAYQPPATTPLVLRSNTMSVARMAAKNKTITAALSALSNATLGKTAGTCTSATSGGNQMLDGLVWLSGSSTDGSEFHWNSSNCNMKVPKISSVITMDKSAVIPANCISKLGAQLSVGTVLLAPIYEPSKYFTQLGLDRDAWDNVSAQPSLSIKIVGFAPFKVTGWNFGSKSGGTAAACSTIVLGPGNSNPIDCEGISGYFVRSMKANTDFTYEPGVDGFNAFDVKLTE